jgi:hypothetical protein
VAWEWVPPVTAAASTTIVVGMTLWATSRTGRQGREHAETVARQTAEHTEALTRQAAEHAEKMAVEERTHKRLEAAYIEMLQMIGRAGHWAIRVYPLMDYDPPQPMPDLPSPDDQARVRALISAYGSAEVKRLFEEFGDLIHGIRIAADTITFAQTRSLGEMESEYRLKLDGELRPALTAKQLELADLVTVELSGSARSDVT